MKNKSLKLGNITSKDFINDPKRLGITLSRYKFVGKMFEGFNSVLEIGAGDGFKSISLKNSFKFLTLTDININKKKIFEKNYKFKNIKYKINNFVDKPFSEKFDGIFALDVLEHIEKKNENKFIINLKKSLKKNGSVIIGMPSSESQKYASKLAKKEHVNCKTKKQLKDFLKNHFNCVYMFSMNDELLHTGFDGLSHYIIGVSN